MAQFDNDQQARGRAPTRAAATAAGAASGRISPGRVAPDERRREHLLSSSSCSSCSSSASSRTFSADGSADDDDDNGGEADRTSRSLLARGRRTKCERGHYSGRRLHQEHHHSMQGLQTQTGLRAGNGHQRQQQQHCNGELVPLRVTTAAVGGPVGLGDSDNSWKSRQLTRQHSDGSAIGAQLMNVLKINDDLSNSSHARLFTSTDSGNMLTGHPHELDTRRTMPTATASGAAMNQSTNDTSYDHDHDHDHGRGILSRGQATPLVVVSPVAHNHQHHYQDLYLVSADAGQDEPFGNAQHYGQYPIMEPLVMIPSHAPFYNPHHPHHHHHHHLQHATYANQLVAADGGGQQQQQQLSYADLDEETARYQNGRRQQQQAPAESLPETVIRANEHLAAGNEQRHHAFYSHQHNYVESNLTTSMPQASSLRHETNTTLTALNSSFSGDVEQRAHRQLAASSASLNVALKDLSGATADEVDGGRWKGQRATDQQQQQQAELSLADSEHIVVEQTARNSPNDMEEELKVCEWRDCGNTFLDMNEFVRHLEEKHVNLEPREKNRFFCLWHNCKRNNQEFNARYKLLIHMRVHSGEKPYFCQNVSCKKSFSRLENLKIHVRSHTGEKPYRCQYEHCSKSFTNSSDRIKHHKTHKDPKPYNCTHNGCTKRYTDPSSLRKHLRAHKRHSFGDSMDSSCESSAITVAASDQRHHSNASCSFSSTRLDRSHGPKTSSSAAAMSHELHYANQHNRNRYHEQSDQAHHYEPYAEEVQLPQQQQQVGGSELEHHQQESSYLHADYDPSQEFANSLSHLNGTMREEIVPASGQELAATYYVESTFERPYQRDPQQQHLGSVDNLEASSGHETNGNSNSGPPYCTQQADQYLPPTTQPIPTNWNRDQRPQLGRVLRRQMDSLRDPHQQLSKSWCGSGSLPSSQQQTLWANTGRHQQQQAQLQQQPLQQYNPKTVPSQLQTSIWPPTTRRHVEFECAPRTTTTTQNYQTEANWTGSRTALDYDQQQQQMDADVHCQQQQQQHYDQSWPTQQSHGPAGPATGDNQQHQILYSARQQQSQPHHQQQQHQPLTRRQQHTQLMRSMPATVNFYPSRGTSFEGT